MYNHITDYQTRGVYPFHMPGHKRNPAFLPPDLHNLDVTEFGGMDNLHAPSGIIKALQEKISRIYGADESFMLVNGTSCGITAAICAACGERTTLYAPRGCHQSVFYGMILSGARPEYQNMERADVVIITSPSYEGKVQDIAEIAGRVHKRGGILIVDEAHGAHFPFHKSFPPPAITQGADIVINSLHKTLPAFSQTAALHVRHGRADVERLKLYLRIMQTSSPSYIFMAAADYMLDKLVSEPEHFDRYAESLSRLRAALPGEGERLPVTLVSRPDYERSKLLFALQTDTGGKEIEKRLADEYRLQLEMSAERSLLAMTSVADTEEGFCRLERAVRALNGKLPFTEREASPDEAHMPVPVIDLTPAQAVKRQSEAIPLRKAAGRTAAEFVTEYPPGIPALVPGEMITEEIIEMITREHILVIK